VNPIIIENLDNELRRQLEAFAASKGLGVSQAVKEILRESLGAGNPPVNHRSDFEEFCGQWTAEDKRDFEEAVKE
jgi:plasmid stability protein